MIGVVVVTHGQPAVELLNAAATIDGDTDNFGRPCVVTEVNTS